MKFPTGGKVRERKLNRCDSGTDSTVWMEEDYYGKYCPKISFGHFYLKGKDIMKNTQGTPIPAERGGIGIRYIAVTGVLAAIAFVLQLIEIPIPFLMPTFIKFDFSDLPALVGAFAMGPVCGVLIELLKNVIHILDSGSFGVGELSNFMLGAVFVGVAGVIYRFNRTKKGAVIGSVVGALAMAAFSFPSNLLVVYPVYYNFMPKETIIGAYQAILPSVKSIEQCLLIFNVPFTFVKGMADVVVTFVIYKHISPLLKGKK